MMAQSETERVQYEASVRFFDPMQLFSTQATGCPSNDHVIPYDHTRDPGIIIGVDEYGRPWILDGHNRVGAAILHCVMVKIGEIHSVNAFDMHALMDG